MVLVGIAALLIITVMGGSGLFALTTLPSTKIVGDDNFRTKVRRALQTADLGGMDWQLLLTMSDLETGGGYSEKGNATFAATNSLFNRHAGSGKGYWTGKTYYAGPGDPDLRVYSSMEQSIQDIVQLLRDDGYYHLAYAYAVSGDGPNFFKALKNPGNGKKGYSTQVDYESALNNRYAQLSASGVVA